MADGYEDKQCPTCKRVGMNVIEKEPIVYGDQEDGYNWVLICKCGEVLEVFEEHPDD